MSAATPPRPGLLRRILAAVSKGLLAFGTLVNGVLLTILYFTVVAPFGLVARFVSRPLGQSDSSSPPRWTERPPDPPTLEAARRQG